MGTNEGVARTLDHAGPEAGEGTAWLPALVAAFPSPIAITIAALRGILGRRTLREQGLQDLEISSEHARLELRGSVATLTDLGSRNGTHVDGRRLAANESVVLVDGALVRVGRSLFVYRERFKGGLTASAPLGQLVSPFGLRDVAQALSGIALRPTPFVLIEGDTGTGKELLARHVVATLGRETPYAAVNVAGIAEGVFESQLFGHVAGAFSDARTASLGVLSAHEGGAVFLDEVGSLPLALQSKLLRLLDQREVLPVGATRPHFVDVLLVAATNECLEDAVAQGRFRGDLLARLAIARLELPPLRERVEDVFAIAQHLAARHRIDLDPAYVEVEAMERLLLHAWPRNIRELEGILRQAATLDPRPGLRLWCMERLLGEDTAARSGLLSEDVVAKALDLESGNETAAARRIGVTRGKLRRFLSKKGPSI